MTRKLLENGLAHNLYLSLMFSHYIIEHLCFQYFDHIKIKCIMLFKKDRNPSFLAFVATANLKDGLRRSSFREWTLEEEWP